MNRRVEFSLNMDNPHEAALYDALADLLRHRRAGEVIRQALTVYLFADTHPQPMRVIHTTPKASALALEARQDSAPIDEPTTNRIVEQSAEMFGF